MRGVVFDLLVRDFIIHTFRASVGFTVVCFHCWISWLVLPGPLSPEVLFTTLCRAFSWSLDPLWHVVGQPICQCEVWIRTPSSEASP